jgi:hypothetical protein
MISYVLAKKRIQFHHDICHFLQNISFADQFRMLCIAKSAKDAVCIVIDTYHKTTIFRISQHIFSITRICCEYVENQKNKQVESALIECDHDTFTIIDHTIIVKSTASYLGTPHNSLIHNNNKR